MAFRGLIPTKLHEIRRWLDDVQIDQMLESEQGRARFWARLESWADSHSLIDLLRSTLHLPGDVIECGVYRGRSILAIARAMQCIADDKTIYALDSFSGFPEDSISECDLGQGRRMKSVRKKFRFCADSPTRLNRVFRRFNVNAKLVPGFFSDTLPQFRDHKFCFIHLDCDIYSSYKECLESLFDRLVPGGVLVLDEWAADDWPGARQAGSEFLSDRPEVVQLCRTSDTHCHYIRKLAVAARVFA